MRLSNMEVQLNSIFLKIKSVINTRDVQVRGARDDSPLLNGNHKSCCYFSSVSTFNHVRTVTIKSIMNPQPAAAFHLWKKKGGKPSREN